MRLFRLLIVSALALPLVTATSFACDCSQQGDMNGNGTINITDLTYMVAWMFSGGPEPLAYADCPSDNAADFDCSINVNIADLTYFVAYLFSGGQSPCDYCSHFAFPDSDPITVEYATWVDTNLFNMIYDTSTSAFWYRNNPGTTLESLDEIIGDTVQTTERRSQTMSGGRWSQYVAAPSSPASMDMPAEGSYPMSGARGEARVTFTPGQSRLNGSTVNNTQVQIVGNVIHYMGDEINMDEPFAYGPPSLAQRIYNTMTSPPDPPSETELENACLEGEVNEGFEMDVISVFQTRYRSYSSGEDSYFDVSTYSFSLVHGWNYECPDGPLVRNVTITFRTTRMIFRNGELTGNYSTEQTYSNDY